MIVELSYPFPPSLRIVNLERHFKLLSLIDEVRKRPRNHFTSQPFPRTGSSFQE